MVRLSPRSFRVVAETEQPPELSSAPADSDHVGSLLREERLAHGYELRQIAYALRIRFFFLQAIEEGRFADLPGAAYAVGFVRSYASFLSLDGDAVVARFKAETAALREQPALEFPDPTPEGKFPGGAVVALSAILIAGSLIVWTQIRDDDSALLARIAPPPSMVADATHAAPSVLSGGAAPSEPSSSPPTEQAGVVPAPAEPPPEPQRVSVAASSVPEPKVVPDATVAVTAVDLATPAKTPPVTSSPADRIDRVTATALPPIPEENIPEALETRISRNDAAAEPREPQVVGNASSAVAAEPEHVATAVDLPELPAVPLPEGPGESEGRKYGLANKDARIVIRATTDSWVQVRDGDQNVLLTRMLRPGDSYRVPDLDDLWLLTGNAGGLELAVDGRIVAPLGPLGAVRRNIALDPDALRAAKAVAQ